jgi:hypothetical protein
MGRKRDALGKMQTDVLEDLDEDEDEEMNNAKTENSIDSKKNSKSTQEIKNTVVKESVKVELPKVSYTIKFRNGHSMKGVTDQRLVDFYKNRKTVLGIEQV